MMILEGEGVVALVLLAFWLWALFDCIATDGALCRNLPKVVWLILVIVLFDIGALAWLLLGRPQRAGWRPGSTDYSAPRRPIALEDEPRYTSIAGTSDRRSDELNRQLEAWEAEHKEEDQANLTAHEPLEIQPPAASDGMSDLDRRQAELDAREQELRRRELELRERELDERDRRLRDD